MTANQVRRLMPKKPSIREKFINEIVARAKEGYYFLIVNNQSLNTADMKYFKGIGYEINRTDYSTTISWSNYKG